MKARMADSKGRISPQRVETDWDGWTQNRRRNAELAAKGLLPPLPKARKRKRKKRRTRASR